jgi:aminomethyltransferase
VEQGAKMVGFAGYEMPVHYPTGIIAEHNQTRNSASLFDVSHMGQIVIRGAEAVQAFEHCVPSSVRDIKPGSMRYTVMLNDWGGVLDDLIMVRPPLGDDLWLIVNAGCKENDLEVIKKSVGATNAELVERDLLALQGPKAHHVLKHYISELDKISFMQARWTDIQDIPVILMRSGYTGEDGFEIAVAPSDTEALANVLMRHEEVKPAGLGARDTLRLEAGLCLYGHELSEKVTPVEAGLNWVIDRQKLSEGEFAGASILEAQLVNRAELARVGFLVDDRTPAREGCEITSLDGRSIGHVTSGGFSPSLNQPIAMGYVEKKSAVNGTKVRFMVRERAVPAHVAPMPFVPHRYFRKK